MAATHPKRSFRQLAAILAAPALLLPSVSTSLHAQATCLARWGTTIPFSTTHPHGSAVADLNGDGIRDFAIAYDGGVRVCLGTGAAPLSAASFSAPTTLAVTGTPFAVIAADLTGDGVLDLATANNANGTIAVLRGNGDGTFAAPIYFPAGSVPFYLAAADFDGDGRLDLVVSDNACSTGGANLLFALPPLIPGQPRFAAPISFPLGCNPGLITTADFNGDHRPDVAIAVYGTGKLQVLMNVGGPTWLSPVTVASGLTNAFAVAAADLDGDGKVDLVSGSAAGTQVHWGAGNGTFAAGVVVLSGATSAIGIGDQDGDGDLDVACEVAGVMKLLLQTSPRSFTATSDLPSMSGVLGTRLVDFDRDGRADLLAAQYSAGIIDVLPSICQPPPILNPPVPDPAGPGWDAQGKAVGATAISQGFATEIPDQSGGCYVVWLNSTEVRAQHLSAAGQRLWSAAGIALCPLAQTQSLPAAISDGAGGFYAAWLNDPSGVRRVRLVRMQASGVPASGWSACGIEATASSFTKIQTAGLGLAPDATGGVFVVDVEGSLSTPSVRAYHYSSSGALATGWPPSGIEVDHGAGPDLYDLISPQVASNGSGGLVVDDNVHYGTGEGGQASGSRTVFVGANGSVSVPLFLPISQLAQAPAGATTIVSYFDGNTNLHALASGSGGATLWNTVLGQNSPANLPAAVPDGAGGVFFAWNAAVTQGFDLLGARLNSSGVPAAGWSSGATTLIAQPGDQTGPQLAGDGSGGFVLVWSDKRSGDQDIYFTRFDALGHVVTGWSSTGTALVSIPGLQQRPLVALTDPVSAIAVWEDFRGGPAQIYAQHISLDQPVAALASLQSISTTPSRATLRWQVSGPSAGMRVQRSADGGWATVGAAVRVGEEIVEWIDDDVSPGERIGYRLADASGAVIPGSEAWAEIPTEISLALRGFDPNPAATGVVVSFALPSGSPATLGVFDVSGRRLVAREVGTLGAGIHRIALGSGTLAPGFYVIRLTQAGATRIQRGVVLR